MATKRKKGINSRAKGGNGERAALKLIEAWWNPEGAINKKFFRTPGSGGLATMGFKFQNLDIAGDITTPDPTWPFCVEIKNCEGWHLEQLLTAAKCDFYSWWDQTVNETPSHLIPLLIFKKNHHEFLFAMRKSDFVLDISAPYLMLNGEVLIGRASDLWATDPNLWKKV